MIIYNLYIIKYELNIYITYFILKSNLKSYYYYSQRLIL